MLVGVTFAVAVGVAALAGSFEDATTAYQHGDYVEALRLFRPLAEQGDAGGEFGLGSMYALGQGVRQDFVEAAKWLRLAAAQGVADAQYDLGLQYVTGYGVPRDEVMAYLWFDLAAARGNEHAAAFRDELAKQMTPDQVAAAQRLAQEWKPNPKRR
jgi:TPR repeat protein